MDVTIITDDLTGAANTGVQLAQAGYRTAVTFRNSPMSPAEDFPKFFNKPSSTDIRYSPKGKFSTSKSTSRPL
jgi:uncharacterized protein YgbK (DUF1537 family)